MGHPEHRNCGPPTHRPCSDGLELGRGPEPVGPSPATRPQRVGRRSAPSPGGALWSASRAAGSAPAASSALIIGMSPTNALSCRAVLPSLTALTAKPVAASTATAAGHVADEPVPDGTGAARQERTGVWRRHRGRRPAAHPRGAARRCPEWSRRRSARSAMKSPVPRGGGMLGGGAAVRQRRQDVDAVGDQQPRPGREAVVDRPTEQAGQHLRRRLQLAAEQQRPRPVRRSRPSPNSNSSTRKSSSGRNILLYNVCPSLGSAPRGRATAGPTAGACGCRGCLSRTLFALAEHARQSR